MSEQFFGKVGVKALIVRDSAILMVRAKGEPAWDLPGGRLDVGETFEAALEREVREELGLKVHAGRYVHSTQVVHTHDQTNQFYATFVAVESGCDPIRGIDEESAELLWVSRSEVETVATYDNCRGALREYWTSRDR